MIQDSDTNYPYLSDKLPQRYPLFYKGFLNALGDLKIPFDLLPHTSDIWAKDFMPVQINESEFVQFIFDPDYLKPKEYHHLLTKPGVVCDAIGLSPELKPIVLDGGNVIKTSNKIIICEKIFKENPSKIKSDLIDELVEQFKADKIIFIPWDRNDFTGHSDGMVRFVDDDNVIINERTYENPQCEELLRSTLKQAKLNIIEMPFSPPNDPTYLSAKGLHLNFLQMKQAIIVPVFNQTSDDRAMRTIENIFTGQIAIALSCEEIAEEGGVLNCISWNILIN